MSKNDKNIDAYSKALLDKKTEYNNEKNISTPQQKEKEQAWFP